MIFQNQGFYNTQKTAVVASGTVVDGRKTIFIWVQGLGMEINGISYTEILDGVNDGCS